MGGIEMKKCLFASIALVLVVLAAGCGGSKGQSSSTASNGGTGSSKQYAELRWAAAPWEGPLNFTYTDWPEVGAIESLAVQSLVEFEPNGKVKPGLASSIEHPNPITYIYHIRSGVKFSNGKPLTIADVVFSLERNHGKNALVAKGLWEGVSSISAQGDSAVVIKLKKPEAAWPDIMGVSSGIIEKAQAERVGEKALGTPGKLPIGTGPWKFDSYQPEVSVHLSRNPYWTGAPQPAAKIDVSIFKQDASIALALRSGSIDGTFVAEGAPKTFNDIPGTRLLSVPGYGVMYVGLKTSSPPFTDVHVRRAIAYATDFEGMIKASYPPGLASESRTIFPNSLLADLGPSSQVSAMVNSLPRYDFDLTKAKEELAKSAYPHGFTTTIYAESWVANAVSASQILSSDLAQIGIKAKVDLIQTDEISSAIEKGTIIPGIQPPEYPDPSGLAALLSASERLPHGSGYNFAGYSNAEAEKLMSEQAEAVNPTTRIELIGKALRIVEAEFPYRPLYSPDFLVALSDKYVFPPFSFWSTVDTPWALNVKLAK
jgi:peptide/nickel transport system substrate-binding protein